VLVDMTTARGYETEGDIGAAAEAYVAIAAANNADNVEATLAAGRLLIESQDYADARTLLEPFVKKQAGTPEGLTGVYLLGRAYWNLEMLQPALDQFDAYIAGNGPATPYAYLDRSGVLLEMDRGVEAAEAAQKGLDLGVPESTAPAFLLAAAQADERAGLFQEAIGYYNRLVDEGADADAALAFQRISSLKQLLGDPTYTVERDRLWSEYPSSDQAMSAMQDAADAGETIDPTVQGLVLYRHNEYTQAEPYFQQQVDAASDAPESATAYYYLGAILESRDDLDGALTHYAAVDQTDARSPLADDALWWRARIEENAGDLEEAGALYSRIANEYPDSNFAGDAAFRHGLLAYRADSYFDAASIWQSDAASMPDPSDRRRLLLWRGKALLMAGQRSAAESAFGELMTGGKDDYFGIRSIGLSEGLHKHPTATKESSVNLSPIWDWTSAEQWLASATGKPATDRSWQVDPRWARAQELWAVGRTTYGDQEALDLIQSYASDPTALYTLSRDLLAEGRVSLSARTGEVLLSALDAGPSEGVPKEVLSLAYPAAFGPLVQRYSDAEGISPLLMLAFVRQESFFNPRAASGAGALGLTQLVPDSAQSMASELGLSTDVSREQLLHADLSLRLGARFMADQLARFKGDIFVALAAYNGGPTSAERWNEQAGDDADLYLETIEYSESRAYVEIVAENYAIYRYLYGGEPEPNLPQ
jgi:soluble lytic murein transglycosylase